MAYPFPGSLPGLCLSRTILLVARTAGLERALQVARIDLIDWHHLGQQPYAVLTCGAQNEDAVIAAASSAWRTITTATTPPGHDPDEWLGRTLVQTPFPARNGHVAH